MKRKKEVQLYLIICENKAKIKLIICENKLKNVICENRIKLNIVKLWNIQLDMNSKYCQLHTELALG